MPFKLDHLEHEHTPPDAWHQHSPEEGAPQVEHASQVSTVGLGVVFVAMTVMTVVLVVIVAMYFQRHITNLRRERTEIVFPIADLQIEYRQEANRELTTYGWVNEEAQTVRVPIESVYDTIIQEHAGTGE